MMEIKLNYYDMYQLKDKTKESMRYFTLGYLQASHRHDYSGMEDDYWIYWGDSWYLNLSQDEELEWHCAAVHSDHRGDKGEVYDYETIELNEED